jgi:sugar/nucleoside kinase (ribokinase family)
VLRRERQCGGLTATALVAASRMGARCSYAGTLGDDELSQFVIERLREERIDSTHLRRRAGTRPIHSIVIVTESQGSRTIFYDLHDAVGAEDDWPSEDVIRSARVLAVDHFGVEGMVRATRIARTACIPVVADFESARGPGFGELLKLVDHLIISNDFAVEITGESSPQKAAKALWSEERSAIVITCGSEGCWYLSRDQGCIPTRYPAFAVNVLDTTGCGDVFHGAYASALVRGLDLPGRVRLAAAAAALKATQRGGQAGIPTFAAVADFLKEHGDDR